MSLLFYIIGFPKRRTRRQGLGPKLFFGRQASVKQSSSYRSRNLAKRIKYVTRCLVNTLGFNDHVSRFAIRLQELADDIEPTGRKNHIQAV